MTTEEMQSRLEQLKFNEANDWSKVQNAHNVLAAAQKDWAATSNEIRRLEAKLEARKELEASKP